MPLQPFSEDQILDRLRFENPWWVTGAVENFYTTMRRRVYFELFKPVVTELDIRRAVVLMGPRKSG